MFKRNSQNECLHLEISFLQVFAYNLQSFFYHHKDKLLYFQNPYQIFSVQLNQSPAQCNQTIYLDKIHNQIWVVSRMLMNLK